MEANTERKKKQKERKERKGKWAIMFHQYNNVIKIKLTRPRSRQLWDRGRGRQLRRKDNIGLEDDRSRWYQRACACNSGRPTPVSREQFNAVGVSSFLRTSTTPPVLLHHPPLSLLTRPFPLTPLFLSLSLIFSLAPSLSSLSSILMRVMFIPHTSSSSSYREYPRVCRDVGACPRAWGARACSVS